MRSYEASSAVDSAKTWIAIMSWIAIVVGVIILIIGIIIEAEPIGLIIIGSGIAGLFVKAFLKGFYSIVVASEVYIAEHSSKGETSSEK